MATRRCGFVRSIARAESNAESALVGPTRCGRYARRYTVSPISTMCIARIIERAVQHSVLTSQFCLTQIIIVPMEAALLRPEVAVEACRIE